MVYALFFPNSCNSNISTESKILYSGNYSKEELIRHGIYFIGLIILSPNTDVLINLYTFPYDGTRMEGIYITNPSNKYLEYEKCANIDVYDGKLHSVKITAAGYRDDIILDIEKFNETNKNNEISKSPYLINKFFVYFLILVLVILIYIMNK